jgi:hypothetical protein
MKTDEVQARIDDMMKSSPGLQLDLTPYCRAEDQKIRLTVTLGDTTVVQDHIKPNVDWHILYLMEQAIKDAFAKGVVVGETSALNAINIANRNIVLGNRR